MKLPFFATLIRPILSVLNALKPLVDLLVRCWIAYIFFKAGLAKIHNWHGTVMLFTHEYKVLFLPSYIAAVLGTAAELILPCLLVVGFGGRIMVLIFFIYNAIAVLSYPFLWTEAGMVGLNQHVNWALLLAMLMTHGSGRWSLDHWLRKRYVDCSMKRLG